MNSSLESLLQDLRREYIAALPDKIRVLENFFAQTAYDSLRNEFHKLKGTGKTYGVPEITKLSEAVESLCDQVGDELQWVIPSAIVVLRKIYQTRQANHEYGVDQDQDFIKIRQRLP